MVRYLTNGGSTNISRKYHCLYDEERVERAKAYKGSTCFLL